MCFFFAACRYSCNCQINATEVYWLISFFFELVITCIMFSQTLQSFVPFAMTVTKVHMHAEPQVVDKVSHALDSLFISFFIRLSWNCLFAWIDMLLPYINPMDAMSMWEIFVYLQECEMLWQLAFGHNLSGNLWYGGIDISVYNEYISEFRIPFKLQIEHH